MPKTPPPGLLDPLKPPVARGRGYSRCAQVADRKAKAEAAATVAAMRARDAALKARAIELASAAGDPAETLDTLNRILREARARS